MIECNSLRRRGSYGFEIERVIEVLAYRGRADCVHGTARRGADEPRFGRKFIASIGDPVTVLTFAILEAKIPRPDIHL